MPEIFSDATGLASILAVLAGAFGVVRMVAGQVEALKTTAAALDALGRKADDEHKNLHARLEQLDARLDSHSERLARMEGRNG